MISFAPRRAGLFALLGALLVGVPAPLAAQYFGRNKVQYEKFDFRILRTSHFDAYFYPAESLIVHDAGRLAERWYTRHSNTFRHTFDRKSLIYYADAPDFQQTNVVGEQLEEGTGGVTEGLHTRVIMPFTGIYRNNDHVLGHELVHVFQYNIAEGSGGLMRMDALPLWLIEGMAEAFSLGRNDPLTAMWMRDAVMRDKFPTINQLTTDPRFFPYRYGQALWAYVGGRWGDRAVVDVYRTSLRIGFEEGIRRVLGISTDSLSKDWIAATRRAYLPLLEGRARPNGIGTPVLQSNRKTGDMNLAPTVSPDGKLVAFFARRNLFEIELYVADATTGHVIKRLAGPTSNSHFDAISFINASGAWSPDNAKFAFVAQAEGDHEIAILDVRSANVERRIRVPGVGSVTHIAWSPDGRTLAFSGMSGGISDLYLLDVAAGTVRQLTHDRNADLQPAWSPDGRTLAFATDRGPTTDFTKMVFSPLQLATIDVATGQISVFSPFSHGKHINPQYSPDGKSLFFISDQDGFSDIYRLELASGAVSRVTRLSTGVSGITAISPALTVALTSGRMLFSVFQDQGYGVYALDSARTHGDPLVLGVNVAYAGILPPGDTPGRATVTAYLADPATGLPSGEDFTIAPYHSVFALDAVGQPSLGVSAGGPFGTGVAGGVSFLFGDQLSDRQFALGVQANGTIKDIGGQLLFQNLKHRWNYGASIQHVPYLTGFYGLSDRGGGVVSQDLFLQRIYIDQAQFSTSYPFSSTRRVELSAGATRLGFSTQVLSSFFDRNTGQFLGQTLSDTTSIKPVYYAQGSLALVGDASYSAFTGPIMGSRYRLEVSPIAGSLSFTTALADYRKYIFLRPITLAFRGLHYGRYGSDAENDTLLYPLFLGEEQLMRGYSVGSFKESECGTQYTSTGVCPAFDRLLGSKLAVASFEVRIPLFGVPEYGLFNLPYLPTTIAPFVDAGVAWRGGQSLQFGSSADPNVRSPVVSTGISTRVNVLGFAILEAYLAHPFQRPGQGWIWGFQLAPGW
jgi:Tol biopolymer transport system component